MKILIICTWFFPDTAIAAKRPYNFAKQLSKLGHEVTVLRSGAINNAIEKGARSDRLGFDIISYLGEDSAAERYARGEALPEASKRGGRLSFLPEGIRLPLSKLYSRLTKGSQFDKYMARAQGRNAHLVKALDKMRQDGYKFDAVFSTYGELENIWAGKYAAELFCCPWILDLRDHVATKWGGSRAYKRLLEIEKEGVYGADLCTVISQDFANTLIARNPDAKIEVLYNGYEGGAAHDAALPEKDALTFCYTGALYSGRRDLSALFKAIAHLSKNNEIDISKIKLDYAGGNFAELFAQAKRHGVEQILADRGYVSRKEAFALQQGADIFLVASWNTLDERGILTGKFYEGICAKRPILSVVVGSVPDSELFMMNEKYSYGFCYEECKSDFDALCAYIKAAYDAKIGGKSAPYSPSPDLFCDFEYQGLAKRLENFLNQITAK